MPRKLTRRVLQDGAVRWYAQVQTAEVDDHGRAVYVRKTFAKKQAADAFIRRLEVSRDEGLLVKPSAQLLEDWLKHWLDEVVRHRVRENTFTSYSTLAKTYVVPALGRVPLAKLSPAVIRRELYGPMLDRGLAPATLNLVHSLLHGALDQAVVDRLLATNPAKGAKPGKLDRARPPIRPMTREQARAFLEAAEGDRLLGFYRIALATGCRPSELFGLTWEHVDLEAATIRIEQVLVRTGTGWVLRPPKTAAGRRVIPLAPETVDAFRWQRARQAEEKLKLGARRADFGPFCFTTESGEPLDLPNVRNRSFYPALRRAGLGDLIELPGSGLIDRKRHRFEPWFRLYDLRHSAATLMIEAGVHAKHVSERLGHSNVAFTLDTYVHATEAAKSDAADLLAQVLFR